MLLVLHPQITNEEAEQLLEKLTWMGLHAILNQDAERYIITIVSGVDANIDITQFATLPGVAQVLPMSQKYKLASRENKQARTIIKIGEHAIGDGQQFIVMAGPCAVESEQQIFQVAENVAKAGAQILRGGVFKPRTSPYDFQGMGEQGLKHMHAAAKKFKLALITEVMSVDQIDLVARYADVLQIGARNMQNYSLLIEIAKANKPVLLKRGLSATYQEWLLAAEYILRSGNGQVILCERGIRTFESYTRNTLDLAAVPVMHELSHLPIIIDPSHGVGIRKFVPDLARAAVAVGADGLMIEVHPQPEKALSDGPQSLTLPEFAKMMESIKAIALSMQK